MFKIIIYIKPEYSMPFGGVSKLVYFNNTPSGFTVLIDVFEMTEAVSKVSVFYMKTVEHTYFETVEGQQVEKIRLQDVETEMSPELIEQIRKNDYQYTYQKQEEDYIKEAANAYTLSYVGNRSKPEPINLPKEVIKQTSLF